MKVAVFSSKPYDQKFFEKYNGYISSHDGPKTDFDKLQELAKKIKKFN